MRRDQVLFLGVGVVLGLIIGLVIGYGLFAGGGAVAAPAQVQAPPSGGGMPPGTGQPGGGMPPGADPHAMGGDASVGARMTALRERLDRNPNDVDALVSLGELFLAANMRERAHEPLHKALDLVGPDAAMLTRIAVGLAQSGTPDEGMKAAERALAADRTNPAPAEIATQIAIRGLADLEKAEAMLAELKRRAPTSPNIEELSDEVGRTRRTLADAAAKPADYDAQVRAGNFLFDVGRWAESEQAYRRALTLRPGDPDVVTDLGIAIFRQGRGAEALVQFDEAHRRDPRHWQSALNAIVVALDMNDTATAKTWLARLKATNPQHPLIPQFDQQLAGR
jgi:tetratricopeptide (TPR) repeat protein